MELYYALINTTTVTGETLEESPFEGRDPSTQPIGFESSYQISSENFFVIIKRANALYFAGGKMLIVFVVLSTTHNSSIHSISAAHVHSFLVNLSYY